MTAINDPYAKKSLGQHWLNDIHSLEAVCDGADVQAGDTVIEIGPGPGALTLQLLKRGAQVIAIEFDHDLAVALPLRIQSLMPALAPNLTVIEADILTYDFSTLPAGYKVAANIPYYLTSNLLRILTESPHHFSLASILVQKEVAERVCAAPGQMSLLSLAVQLYCRVGLGPLVPARLFTPPPKVDSQILLLEFVGTNESPEQIKRLFQIAKAGFSERRKKLRSSLSGGLHMTKDNVAVMLGQAHISPDARAQELSVDDWKRLSLNNP